MHVLSATVNVYDVAVAPVMTPAAVYHLYDSVPVPEAVTLRVTMVPILAVTPVGVEITGGAMTTKDALELVENPTSLYTCEHAALAHAVLGDCLAPRRHLPHHDSPPHTHMSVVHTLHEMLRVPTSLMVGE